MAQISRTVTLMAVAALAACGPTQGSVQRTTSSGSSSPPGSTAAASTSGATSTSGTSANPATGTTTATAAASTTTTGSASTTTGGASTTTGGDCCGGVCTGAGQSCDSACQCASSACQTGADGPIPADAIDLGSVTILNSPDVSSWPVTTAITNLDLQASGAHLEFSKKDGANRWPDYDSGSVGQVEYTLWLFENIGGQWYGSAGIRFSNSDYQNGGAPSGYGANWFYDPGRWGVMANRQPAVGELVGFMVSAGDARDSDGTNLQERSNIVVVPFPSDTGVDYSCYAGQGTSGGTGTTTTGGGTTTSGTTGTTGNGSADCCSGTCSPSAQYCDPTSCTCAAQGSFDLSQASVYDSPADIANWPVTTTITRLDIESSGFHVEFSKADGPDRWPDVIPPGWGGPLQYTLWSVEYIDGSWVTSGPIEYWYGLYESGGAPSSFAADWYYDSRWGPLANYQPAVGEMVGFFVAAGNTRNVTGDDDAQSPVRERSNVVIVPFPSDTGQNFTF